VQQILAYGAGWNSLERCKINNLSALDYVVEIR
jgi:hypothetical protein